MPTVSISLPVGLLTELDAETKIAQNRNPGSKLTMQDIMRKYIRLGITYSLMLEKQEEEV